MMLLGRSGVDVVVPLGDGADLAMEEMCATVGKGDGKGGGREGVGVGRW